MILIRANTERQILVIRARLVSAPPSECLEIRLCQMEQTYASLWKWKYVIRLKNILI